MSRLARIAISIGDPAGVGSEIGSKLSRVKPSPRSGEEACFKSGLTQETKGDAQASPLFISYAQCQNRYTTPMVARAFHVLCVELASCGVLLFSENEPATRSPSSL